MVGRKRSIFVHSGAKECILRALGTSIINSNVAKCASINGYYYRFANPRQAKVGCANPPYCRACPKPSLLLLLLLLFMPPQQILIVRGGLEGLIRTRYFAMVVSLEELNHSAMWVANYVARSHSRAVNHSCVSISVLAFALYRFGNSTRLRMRRFMNLNNKGSS